MKTFLAVYIGSLESLEKSGWNSLAPEKKKELEAKGIKAWGDWMNEHKDAIVVQGGPLGKTKKIDAKNISDFKNKMCGYVVVKASSHEDAAKMFVGHPHVSIFPGESIELMECLPIPS